MNTKLLGKTLVASALVLTTLGTGFHSSYLGLDTNKVVKTAKAEEKTNTEIWQGVKKSLIDSNIISGNEGETVKITFLLNNGQSTNIESTANHDNFTNTKNDFSKLTKIEITKINIPGNDFNTTVDANETWNKFTKYLLDNGLVSKGDKVTIHTKDSQDPQISGTVGSDKNDQKGYNLNKRDINKITIE
ncbi:DUF4888 domain-containing protein [Staphylococcus argenteus]|uniref:DUF4888 domain-containing protein n=1 Tax=Staphylococcus argenteus TaxID=985002 RepID=UPI001EFE543B|nr:DUF4888 domain-containing protein [Staphylococcus argenteus]MCG9811993.1 DUF4888 domain-containing protein [Staphylococcus argenteus]MCG9825165.1 DUF4888 domain-containing protein [Staphylococcus argenteus]